MKRENIYFYLYFFLFFQLLITLSLPGGFRVRIMSVSGFWGVRVCLNPDFKKHDSRYYRVRIGYDWIQILGRSHVCESGSHDNIIFINRVITAFAYEWIRILIYSHRNDSGYWDVWIWMNPNITAFAYGWIWISSRSDMFESGLYGVRIGVNPDITAFECLNQYITAYKFVSIRPFA